MPEYPSLSGADFEQISNRTEARVSLCRAPRLVQARALAGGAPGPSPQRAAPRAPHGAPSKAQRFAMGRQREELCRACACAVPVLCGCRGSSSSSRGSKRRWVCPPVVADGPFREWVVGFASAQTPRRGRSPDTGPGSAKAQRHPGPRAGALTRPPPLRTPDACGCECVFVLCADAAHLRGHRPGVPVQPLHHPPARHLLLRQVRSAAVPCAPPHEGLDWQAALACHATAFWTWP